MCLSFNPFPAPSHTLCIILIVAALCHNVLALTIEHPEQAVSRRRISYSLQRHILHHARRQTSEHHHHHHDDDDQDDTQEDEGNSGDEEGDATDDMVESATDGPVLEQTSTAEMSQTATTSMPTPAPNTFVHNDEPAITANPATAPTPLTLTANTEPVALFVPPYDPNVDPGQWDIQYLGPGNGHSTIYQVVYRGDATRPPHTATLAEDASNANLIGAQQATIMSDGQSTDVWAAVSCGYQDGLQRTAAQPSAGYCVYWNKAGQATSTWTTAVSTITAQTTITPSPGAVQSSIAAVKSANGQYFVKPHNGVASAKMFSATPYISIILVALPMVLFQL